MKHSRGTAGTDLGKISHRTGDSRDGEERCGEKCKAHCGQRSGLLLTSVSRGVYGQYSNVGEEQQLVSFVLLPGGTIGLYLSETVLMSSRTCLQSTSLIQ